MLTLENILLLVGAYLLGSIPTAVWVGQFFFKIDVREYGSGNAGATNTFRVLGVKAGVPVLVFDILKGFLAAKLALLVAEPSSSSYIDFQLAFGVAALLGHIFPVYVGFRGGKGIATLLGIMVSVHYQAALSALLIFLVIFLVTRYVSLSSMAGALCFPAIVILIFQETTPSLVIFSLFIAIIVLITHQKNIERLLRKEEAKANISLRKRMKSIEDEDDLD